MLYSCKLLSDSLFLVMTGFSVGLKKWHYEFAHTYEWLCLELKFLNSLVWMCFPSQMEFVLFFIIYFIIYVAHVGFLFQWSGGFLSLEILKIRVQDSW